jgi:hypothetical protein
MLFYLHNYLRQTELLYPHDQQIVHLLAFQCAALAESLFKSYREDYAEFELTSLNQLHKAKVRALLSSFLEAHTSEGKLCYIFGDVH